MGEDNQIIGYAVANDLSARDLQRSEKQWARAKGFDGSCPWGPWITTTDELPDALGLRITTHVNNELRQDGNTRSMIFNPREIVDFIAEACTLEPGAIVLTGTPSGVGEAFDPPRYLQPGDTVRVRDRSARRDRALGPVTPLVRVDDAVDQAVLGGLVGGEEAVALHVAVHHLFGLTRVLGVDLVDALARLDDLAGVDLDVRGLALEARLTAGGSGSASSAATCACPSRRRPAAANPSTSRSRRTSSPRRA